MSQPPTPPIPGSPAPQPLSLNTVDWLRYLAENKHDLLCRQLITALDHVGKSTYALPDTAARQRIDLVANLLLFCFSFPSFLIPDQFSEEFVARNHLISNLVAQSSFKTTDAHLEVIRNYPHNYVKALSLYSARNTVKFDRAAIFQISPPLASLWYMQFAELFHAGLPSPIVYDNLREHFNFQHPSLLPIFNLQEPYFGASYIADPVERTIKSVINESVKRNAGNLATLNAPRNPRKIAVLTTHWRPNHSVYRICSALVEALQPRYHLTFVQLGNYARQATEKFDDVRNIESSRGLPAVGPILQNDFQMMLYPDVGMTSESIVLANLRLAPIQVCMLGHSVSTFGADIDYFISGAAVEIPDRPEQNYSERLALLPGMGCVHNVPLYTLRNPAKTADRILINCPWQGHKVNHPSLLALQKIIRAARRPITFRLFIGGGTQLYNDHPAFLQQLLEVLGPGNFQIVTDLTYEDYMVQMEQGHLSLDSWHFGGCNTVSDSLFARVPILCREGQRWYNRIGPNMLRIAGLPELAATTEDQYLETALRLIHDDDWRNMLTQRLVATDLNATIYAKPDVPHFAAAIDYLIENHESLKASPDRFPLRFPRTL